MGPNDKARSLLQKAIQSFPHCSIFSSPPFEYRLYVVRMTGKAIRIGIITPKGAETSFVIRDYRIVERFCEDVIQLLSD